MHVSLFFNDPIDLYVLGLLSKKKKVEYNCVLEFGSSLLCV